jgi:hypothetical protein
MRLYFYLTGVPFLWLINSSMLLYRSDYSYSPAALAGALARRVDDGLHSLFDQTNM